jgi:hypothetical protein
MTETGADGCAVVHVWRANPGVVKVVQANKFGFQSEQSLFLRLRRASCMFCGSTSCLNSY